MVGFAVLPSNGQLSFEAVVGYRESIWRKLEWMRSLAPDPASQEKYLRAMAFVSSSSDTMRYNSDMSRGL
jgi:hypothetical protein